MSEKRLRIFASPSLKMNLSELIRKYPHKATRWVIGRMQGNKMPDHIVSGVPGIAQMVQLFKGQWASKLPVDGVESGPLDLFNDGRIKWFLERVGGAVGKEVLELGPLEGGHTYMCDRAGAARITAIEANGMAWLKCLALKETLGMPSARFLLGDFIEYLEQTGDAYDLCIASGVLYHLRDPQQLFPLLRSRVKGPVLLWTHYWSERIATTIPALNRNFTTTRRIRLGTGAEIVLHRHEYRQNRGMGFTGGNAHYSEWLSRKDLEAAVAAGGYRITEVAFDAPENPSGPCLAMLLDPVPEAASRSDQ